MVAGLGLFGAAGCGSSVDIDPQSSGAGGSGGASTTSASGGGVCSMFDDEESVHPVTVRFRNDSPKPIYLPVECTKIGYTIKPAGGSDGMLYTYDYGCFGTCESLQESAPGTCGACPTMSYRLAPGATRDVVWEGTGLSKPLQMPAACWAPPKIGDTCNRILVAAAGTYVATAVAYDACEDNCSCDAAGVCSARASGAQALSDAPTFVYPSASQVEVVFGTCAFGCPL